MVSRYSKDMGRYHQLKDELLGLTSKALDKSERPGVREYVARALKSFAYNQGVIKNLDVKLSFTPDDYRRTVEIRREIRNIEKKMKLSQRYETRRKHE
jgi:geranylgeranyl pyrophosphate synthase